MTILLCALWYYHFRAQGILASRTCEIGQDEETSYSNLLYPKTFLDLSQARPWTFTNPIYPVARFLAFDLN
ncbi:hypothetical protein BDV10DRAFT_151894 [Aspergillus recurvatus]